MTEQLTTHGDTIAERFRAYHAGNPNVYQELVALARQARARGIERWGIKRLFEVLRWNAAMRAAGDPYKLNNNYSSRYARLIMEQEPDLAGFFEVRELQAA